MSHEIRGDGDKNGDNNTALIVDSDRGGALIPVGLEPLAAPLVQPKNVYERVALCCANAVKEVLRGPVGKVPRGRPRYRWHDELVPAVDELLSNGYGLNAAISQVASQAFAVWNMVTWNSRRCNPPTMLLRRAAISTPEEYQSNRALTIRAAGVALRRFREQRPQFVRAAKQVGLSHEELERQANKRAPDPSYPVGYSMYLELQEAVSRVQSQQKRALLMRALCGKDGMRIIELLDRHRTFSARLQRATEMAEQRRTDIKCEEDLVAATDDPWAAEVMIARAELDNLQGGFWRTFFTLETIRRSGLPENMIDSDYMPVLTDKQLRKLWGGALSPTVTMDSYERDERIETIAGRIRTAYRRRKSGAREKSELESDFCT
jgi:hypothetical protein